MEGNLRRVHTGKSSFPMILGLLLPTLAGWSSWAIAGSSCRHVDYNENPNSALRKIPIYDQCETGICYSYSAVQLADYYRFSHGEPSTDLTNPVYAAYAAAPSGSEKSLYGGFSEDVLASLRQKGTCPNAEVQRDLEAFKANSAMPAMPAMNDAQVLAFLEDTHKNLQQSSPTLWNLPSLSACEVETLVTELSMRGLLGLSARAVLEDTFKSCEAKTKPVNIPETQVFDAGTDSSLQAHLDQALDQSPVAVGVCSKFFDDPNYQGLRGLTPPYIRRAENNVKSDCGGHGVMVTGRRASSAGRCQYLLRNSWGPLWRAAGAVSCACIDLSGQYWENCTQPGNVKEYVGCWFDGDAMVRNTHSVTAFK